jgi:hypothetical protein
VIEEVAVVFVDTNAIESSELERSLASNPLLRKSEMRSEKREMFGFSPLSRYSTFFPDKER